MTEPYCVILTTTGSQEEADRLADLLVTRRLAACVQVFPVSSRYMWKGELHKDPEQILLIKTASSRYREIEAAILENHSYEVPEILRLPIEGGSDRYLDWLSEETA